MKEPTYKGKELLPLSVIDAACEGLSGWGLSTLVL